VTAGVMLELEGIHTYRGAAHVLQGISLRVGPGEAVCLVGRNGAGKTTTIESTMGILPIRGGRILFQDRDIT
jgi:branched-chain amino acid transport system ATP-binding protein